MNTNHVDVERNGEHLPQRQGLTSDRLNPRYYLDMLKNSRVINLLWILVLPQRPFMVWLFDKLSRMMVPVGQNNLERQLPERVHTGCNPSRDTSE